MLAVLPQSCMSSHLSLLLTQHIWEGSFAECHLLFHPIELMCWVWCAGISCSQHPGLWGISDRDVLVSSQELSALSTVNNTKHVLSSVCSSGSGSFLRWKVGWLRHFLEVERWNLLCSGSFFSLAYPFVLLLFVFFLRLLAVCNGWFFFSLFIVNLRGEPVLHWSLWDFAHCNENNWKGHCKEHYAAKIICFLFSVLYFSLMMIKK